jgi:signal transduction histidine kinase
MPTLYREQTLPLPAPSPGPFVSLSTTLLRAVGSEVCRATAAAVTPTRRQGFTVTVGTDAAHHRATDPAPLPPAPAAGPALLFASLARRGAELVDRQFLLLESLQAREDDPERLAGLFTLDHLAARMRRNSNAMLALAGLPTERGISEPIGLGEAAAAAISEVNGYQRVSLGATPAGLVLPSVASDLVHLLGELVDNALAVSPRSSGVRVRGHRVADPPRVTTLIEVVDSGPAVAPEEVARLNGILEDGDADAGRGPCAGLVIVRTLARRHGLSVRLHQRAGDSSGLVAAVALPPHVFTS